MKIIYEHGDVVYNANNDNYGIVLSDLNNTVTILEYGPAEVFVNQPPREVVQYQSKIDFDNSIRSIIETSLIEELLKSNE